MTVSLWDWTEHTRTPWAFRPPTLHEVKVARYCHDTLTFLHLCHSASRWKLFNHLCRGSSNDPKGTTAEIYISMPKRRRNVTSSVLYMHQCLKHHLWGVSRDEIEHTLSNTNNIMTYIHIYSNPLKQKLQEYYTQEKKIQFCKHTQLGKPAFELLHRGFQSGLPRTDYKATTWVENIIRVHCFQFDLHTQLLQHP